MFIFKKLEVFLYVVEHVLFVRIIVLINEGMKGNRNEKGFYLIRDPVGCPVGYYLSNYVGYCDVLFVVICRVICRVYYRVDYRVTPCKIRSS